MNCRELTKVCSETEFDRSASEGLRHSRPSASCLHETLLRKPSRICSAVPASSTSLLLAEKCLAPLPAVSLSVAAGRSVPLVSDECLQDHLLAFISHIHVDSIGSNPVKSMPSGRVREATEVTHVHHESGQVPGQSWFLNLVAGMDAAESDF